jgi:hypothetical protein
MWANSGSADERPSFAVGDAFICRTEVVAALVKKLPGEQRLFIANAIEWGLLNHFDIDAEEKSTNTSFIRLKKRLAAAKK